MKILTLEETKLQLNKVKLSKNERYYVESLLDLAYALGDKNGTEEAHQKHIEIWEK